MDPAVLDALADVGIVGLLLGVLIGGYRGWWRYGPQVDRQVAEITRDRDFWRTWALGNFELAKHAIDAVPASDPVPPSRRNAE